ncbi:MAG: polyphenol oxidase family protein [Gemmatimonadales bacterium]
MTVHVTREIPLPGPVPRFEVPGWRERYGVMAGITGRGDAGGTGFTLGLWGEEPTGEVQGRWRSLRAATPGFTSFVLGSQVHGTAVRSAPEAEGWLIVDGTDGHVTNSAGTLLLVTVADCIPLYLLDPVHQAIALLHAGWRGTSGEILRMGVETMREAFGSVPGDLVMHCGVGICGPCYEVGREVMEGCREAVLGEGPWHLDLRSVQQEQARRLGIRTISTSQWCSSHDRASFFSHRASFGRDGRMVAYLGYPRAQPSLIAD